MMKVAAAFALALSAAAADAQAPRVAVVRVSDVFNKLDSTVKATEQTNARKAQINSDSRLVTYNELYKDLQLRRKALEENPPKIDAETRKRLAREYTIKLQEAKSVLEDFESFRSEKTREIDSEMVAGMKQRLALIHATAEKLAKEEGFDWVLDASGNTNTGVPLLLYAKKANDLTDRVLAALGPAASPPPTTNPPPPKPAPAPKNPLATGKNR
ncbi:OmpH family outer membrane protein [Luteolibacter arcticus]|uniref:OmpH family outer membrane protein n=1 Tax=Luteolibacter arcticus TaxID=1581411 RepID=A0ABT3GP10_9BACT|nr:OmpH family outer membrane protein [Luteolibacter arcticus]MCW1925259.1 OmpH family outer membrane protein [Luteolibacter arcticus]